jgi:hypothetical protein
MNQIVCFIQKKFKKILINKCPQTLDSDHATLVIVALALLPMDMQVPAKQGMP